MKSNKFDEKYDIRFATYDEIDEVMQFIDEYWRKGHILARNRAIFEYEFLVDGKVNIMIAKSRENNKIQGFHGFLKASGAESNFDAWGSLWKVVPGSMGLLGLEIIKRMEEQSKCRMCLSMGGNPTTTVPILKKFRRFEDVGKMDHFYCVSKQSEYRVAKIAHYEPFEGDLNYRVQLIPIHNVEELRATYDYTSNADIIPYKDEWYIDHRFLSYPFAKYQVYGLSEGGKAQALLVSREQEYNGATVLRLVDYIGKPHLFGGLAYFLKSALEKYEYIDFYCYRFDNDYVRQAGMIQR